MCCNVLQCVAVQSVCSSLVITLSTKQHINKAQGPGVGLNAFCHKMEKFIYNLYVCMYACQFVCLYVCMYVYMYVCRFVCTRMYTSIEKLAVRYSKFSQGTAQCVAIWCSVGVVV